MERCEKRVQIGSREVVRVGNDLQQAPLNAKRRFVLDLSSLVNPDAESDRIHFEGPPPYLPGFGGRFQHARRVGGDVERKTGGMECSAERQVDIAKHRVEAFGGHYL